MSRPPFYGSLVVMLTALAKRPISVAPLVGMALAASLFGPANSAPRARAARSASALLTPDLLGARVAFLEAKVGPAWKVEGDFRTYKIGSCEVGVSTLKGDIRTLGIDKVTPTCTLDLNAFISTWKKFPPLSGLTFGAFSDADGGGGLGNIAGCLFSCGNAVDPVFSFTRGGSHADNFIDVEVGVEIVGDPAINASIDLERAMEKANGQDYVLDGKYSCDHRYDALANSLFRSVKITSVSVGHLEHAKCDAGP